MTEETMNKGTEEFNKMVANATANQEEKERFSIENDDQLKWVFQMMEEKRKEIRAKYDMIQQATDYYESQIDDSRRDIGARDMVYNRGSRGGHKEGRR